MSDTLPSRDFTVYGTISARQTVAAGTTQTRLLSPLPTDGYAGCVSLADRACRALIYLTQSAAARGYYYSVAKHEDRAPLLSMRYRYRTAALLGSWFGSAYMARADAIRAGQAYRSEDGAIIWRGSASLEAESAQKVPRAE